MFTISKVEHKPNLGALGQVEVTVELVDGSPVVLM